MYGGVKTWTVFGSATNLRTCITDVDMERGKEKKKKKKKNSNQNEVTFLCSVNVEMDKIDRYLYIHTPSKWRK